MWRTVFDNLNQSKKYKENDYRSTILFLIILFILLYVIAIMRDYVYMSVEVSGSSMQNTLNTGDILVVERTKNVERGDVVVFKFGDGLLIKRVIAVGGDTIWTEDNKVFINYSTEKGIYNVELNESYIYKNNLTYAFAGNKLGELEKITIPEGELFVMGDHREDSYDSRYFGAVSIDRVVGKVPEFVIKHKNDGWCYLFRFM